MSLRDDIARAMTLRDEIKHQLQNYDATPVGGEGCDLALNLDEVVELIMSVVRDHTDDIRILAFNGSQMRIGFRDSGASEWTNDGETSLIAISGSWETSE